MSVLPRIALFLQYVLPRNARNTQNLLTVYSPTEFTEHTEPSCCMFSHRLHRFSQMLLSGGALVSSAPTRSVVALLALLVHLRQVHPLKAASVKICEICGRILSATSSVNSVNSVGEYLSRAMPAGVLPVNLLLAMLAQIGVALREVVVAEPPATVGRQR